MSLTAYTDIVQGTEEWDDLRRGMVTASAVGQLLSVGTLGAIGYDCPYCRASVGDPCVSNRAPGGPIKTMHPHRATVAQQAAVRTIEPATGDTARSLTRLLVAERITGWTDPTYMSDDMIRGREDEPRAIEVYAREYAPVTKVGFLVRDEEWGQLGFSPDGLVGDDGLIEVKSRRAKKHLATILDDDIPAENMAQIQAGLLVSGRAWADYISFSGGMPLWTKRVFPDERWFDAIREAVRLFEKTATEMTATYRARVEGLPMTERIVYEEFVI